MKGGGSISMQCNNSFSAMEMIRSNHLNYNCSTDDQSQTPTPSICNLVNQLMPSSSSSPPPPHVKSHSKNTRETRRPIIQRKKRVRRRFHTTKPYQERLLNMAEARKEIVTALKFHRASMKKQEQKQSDAIIPALMHHIPSEQHQTPLQAPVLPSSNMGVLGLNLTFNFQDYNSTNLDKAADPTALLPIGSPTTPHLNDELLISSSSVNSSGALLQVGPTMSFEDECSSSAHCEGAVAAGPRALDDEEMAEMRSIGEKHQMEWDDTLNLATYAWWFRFLPALDLQEEEGDSLSRQFGDLSNHHDNL